MAIRIASVYRTISTEAVQAIAGTIPIDLMIKERVKTYKTNVQKKKETREETMNKGNERWNEGKGKADWTRKLIKDIEQWTNRKHG